MHLAACPHFPCPRPPEDRLAELAARVEGLQALVAGLEGRLAGRLDALLQQTAAPPGKGRRG
jgi:hypothetical protein